MPADFITTIDSDEEDVPIQNGESSRSQARGRDVPIPAAGSGKASQAKIDEDLNPEFQFDFEGLRNDGLDLWGGDEVKRSGKKDNEPISVDDIIARRTGKMLRSFGEKKRKRGEEALDEESEEGMSESESEEEDDQDEDDEDQDGEDGSEEEDEDVDMASDIDVDLGGRDDGSEEDDNEKAGDDEEDEDEEDEDEEAEEGDDEEDGSSEGDNAAETARKAAFFSTDPTDQDPSIPTSFASMNLSRPLLRSLASLNFSAPTPIQAHAIPLALLGRDILGSAVTGSGKTAAFMVPILERLTYRDQGRGGQACRVLVLCPTRELAVQCEAVGKALAERGGLNVRFALLVGGLSLNAQAHTLRTLPDILIATPGRLIDHLTNTPSFTLSALDILVMDEADRMLEEGFSDELSEIIRACPRSRQTMLFSATMTDSVDELVKLSLDKPIRVFVDPKKNTADSLTQEFVRIRADENRGPALLALCKRTVREKCIVFFRSKALAHQMRVVFGLLGLKAAELHGNLTQEQRLNALNDFKAGRVDYLLATDLASRGLDIKGVETVINYDMPGQLAQYTHRVGRTARAGRKGRSISLVGEPDRKMLKLAIRQSESSQIRHRIIPPEAINGMSTKMADLKDDIADILKEEKEEKVIRQAEMEVRKGQNILEHEDEIMGRPKRVWFQSEKEKAAAKNAGKEGYVGKFPMAGGKEEKEDKKAPKRGKYDGMSRKVKRRKMAIEADEAEGRSASQNASIRAAKKMARPTKIGVPMPQPSKAKTAGKGGKKSGARKSAFDSDRGKRGDGVAGHEGMRAKQVKVNLSKGKSGKAKGGKGQKGGKGKGGGGGGRR